MGAGMIEHRCRRNPNLLRALQYALLGRLVIGRYLRGGNAVSVHRNHIGKSSTYIDPDHACHVAPSLRDIRNRPDQI
jgi:hypothetical protein